MTVLTDDGWEDDEPTGQPWPTSIEAKRWDYDAPGVREYEAEDDMEDE